MHITDFPAKFCVKHQTQVSIHDKQENNKDDKPYT